MARLQRLAHLVMSLRGRRATSPSIFDETATSQLEPPFAAPADDSFARSITQSLLRQRWIATTGSDQNNDGKTYQTAWRTFDHALLRRQDWDVLQVVAGPVAYAASVELYKPDGGSADKPKVIRGVDVNGDPVVPAARPTVIPAKKQAPFVISSEFWILDGLGIDCASVTDKDIPGVFILSGGAHLAQHVAVRNVTIQNCRASAIQVLNARDILIEDNILVNNRHPNPTAAGGNDSNGVSLYTGSERVLIRGNIATNNSGDGVQCEGGSGTIKNVTIEGNIFNRNSENAVDLKGCENVDILRNTELADYRQPNTVSPPDCGGSVIILHNSSKQLSTRRVSIENNNVRSGGVGVAIGRKDADYVPVEDVVVRNNFINNITQAERNCGDGIQIQNVRRAEVYRNVFDRIAHSAIMIKIASNDPPSAVAENVRVWSNIFSDVERTANAGHGIAEGGILDFAIDRMPGLFSDYNVFFHSSSPPRFRNGSTGQILDFVHGITWKTSLVTDTRSVAGTHH